MKSSQNANAMSLNIRQITVVGVLAAITIVLGQSGLGFLIIPGLPAKITIMHIPVIVGAILEGPIVGALVGLLFGVFSIVQNMMVPTALSFAFINPLVSVLPRILIGITAYYSYRAIRFRSEELTLKLPGKAFKFLSEGLRVGIAAAVGTITNTIGVLGMIYLLYAAPYAELNNVSVSNVGKIIMGVGITNGIPEVIAAVIITTTIVLSLKRILKK